MFCSVLLFVLIVLTAGFILANPTSLAQYLFALGSVSISKGWERGTKREAEEFPGDGN
jgi:hypothetical protein